jgi:CO/xanthine dehydrogenase Mo-binding subunit
MFAGCSQIPAGAFLSKKAGRPVKVVFQRKDEQFAEMDEGIHNIKVGFKKDGTITAVQADTKIAQCSDVQVYSDTMGGGHFMAGTKIPISGELVLRYF